MGNGSIIQSGDVQRMSDGAFIEKEDVVRIEGQRSAEVLLFDLP